MSDAGKEARRLAVHLNEALLRAAHEGERIRIVLIEQSGIAQVRLTVAADLSPPDRGIGSEEQGTAAPPRQKRTTRPRGNRDRHE